MKNKMFEIRDAGTCITVIAIKTEPENIKEELFFKRGGWSNNSIILIKTNGEAISNYDAFEWRNAGNRTLFEAHKYIENNFDDLENYSVIDVEYILNEKDKQKKSDIWY